ncbi:hypothetical protein HHK36_033508 [Tetracentron sinense]|uniref:Uncharacterized protein n=1 Tax=Tetracentron sinense TaxID=13715 RepID=A0A834Y5N6_TETSI|nr:hypothetical protein HHK36_033508 [Tetracentron sinense]
MTTAVTRSLLGCSSSGLESAVSMLLPSKLGFVNLQDSNMVGFEKRGKSLGLSMFSSKIVGFAPASLSLSLSMASTFITVSKPFSSHKNNIPSFSNWRLPGL